MDGEPPPIIAQPTHNEAATDLYGRTPREVELCDKASSPAWGYALLWAGGFGVSLGIGTASKYAQDAAVRFLGPGFIGLTWGGLVGSAYAIMPKCHPYFAGGPPPEGVVRSSIPVVTALTLLAGATAPIMVGIDTGPLPGNWTTEERVGRLVLGGVMGVVGALLPYVPFLSPRTLRAARELEKLRIEPAQNGAIVGWSSRF